MKNTKFLKPLFSVCLALSITAVQPVMAAETSSASVKTAESEVLSAEENTDFIEQPETIQSADVPENLPSADETDNVPSTDTVTESTEPADENKTPVPAESETITNDISESDAAALTENTENVLSDNPTKAFVARLYDTLLLRQADEKGLNEWTALLEDHKTSGADIVDGFINSPEFKEQNYSNTEYITVLYHALFNREPDTVGLNMWNEVLNAHLSRNYVCYGFIGSDEFKKLCQNYNILPGTLKVSGILDKNPDTTKFVYRLYKLVLSRDADNKGLQEWVDALISKRNTAAKVVEGFIFSNEFKNKSLSDGDYIEVLYQTLLDRPSDASGKEDWLEVAATGVSRAYILNDFIGSDEFTKLCAQYGVTRGNLTLTENRDKNKKTTEYVGKVFKNTLNRSANVSDLNTWTGKLNSHTSSAGDFIYSLVFSDECKPLISSNTNFVTTVYKAALFRTPSDGELKSWLSTLKKKSKTEVFNDIIRSSEFTKLCKKWGVPNYSDGWNKASDGMYYVKNGKVLTGWQNIDGKKYYLDPAKGGKRANGWLYVDGYKLYFNDGILNQNVDSLIGKQSHYLVKVNTYTNTVTAYAKDGANGYIIPVKTMICSAGKSNTPTVKGTFTIRRLSRWGVLMGPVWGQYCSQIYGGYLFHSAWYYVNGNNRTLSVSEYLKLGNNASHGCVRLTTIDAKWIYDNCNGSTVTVYSSSDMGPFDKPARPNPVRISGDYGYDPTDPTI